MDDETVRGETKDGKKFVDVLKDKGVLCGIKLNGRAITTGKNKNSADIKKGLDELEERCKEYYDLGCRFAEWYAAVEIVEGSVTNEDIKETASFLGRFGSIC